ncbi:MAG TPA: winged helix DNA-binding domain-containing protein, partial [Micromonosporaceae bacterium]
ALRLDGGTRSDVRQALWQQRTVVKTYGPRATVHLLPAAELPLWTGALSAIPTPPTSLPDSSPLTPSQSDDVIAAIGEALRDSELTVEELDAAVVAATGPWASEPVIPAFGDWWPRWRQAIAVAARRGVLCFGPMRGRRVTYTSPSAWLPGFEPADGAAASGELVRRYLYSYGPATPRDFAQWLGAPRAWAVNVFETVRDDLTTAEITDEPAVSRPRGDGNIPWVLASDTDETEPSDSVRLLPYFDSYSVGCHPRQLLYPGVAADRAQHRGATGNYPVLVVGGTVLGIWHHKASGRRITIGVEPFGRLNLRHRRALDDEVARVAEILGGAAELTVGKVAIGPHH